MLHCEIPLANKRRSPYVVHRSNATRVALSAFLDVSSLNLAVHACAAFFLCRHPRRHTVQPPAVVQSTTAQGPVDRLGRKVGR
jgi:hypothetical protein